MIFAVFDLSPLSVCIKCSFFYIYCCYTSLFLESESAAAASAAAASCEAEQDVDADTAVSVRSADRYDTLPVIGSS